VTATPLTYTQSTDPSGATSTLSVTVNDVTWHEVPTLYPAGPRDRVFVTRDTPSGGVEVGFGDGTRCGRLPTGTANVRARYRRGLGTAGNVGTGALAQVVNPPLGVTGVTNPVPAVGGADPEPSDDARAGIPMAVRTLGRAVSLSDYADYARTFAGIARARADVLVLPGGRTIVVSVAGPGGTVVPGAVLSRLVASLVGHGDPLAQVRVVAHRPEKVRLALRVAVDPDRDQDTVLSGVDGALREAFGFAAMDFGLPVHRSGVLRAAHTVPGVVAVDLDRLYRPALGPGLHNRLTPLPAKVTAAGDVLGAGLLTLADRKLDWLEVMS
jgi:predicted phage baseplate assembly protein